MKFIDFFAGIGGFREGLERNDFECVGWVEVDKFKQQAYRTVHNTEGEWHKDDIKSIQPEELPEADIYTGGFPCQSFSIAGNRGGFEDTRGTLFFEIARLAKERQPKYLLLENVKGLLSHDGGRTFGTILQTLWDIGYNVEWQVLNSKDFGVPQNRERIFIIGHLRGQSRPKVFPIRKVAKEVAIGIIGTTQNPEAEGTNSRHWVHDTDGIVGAVGASDYKQPKQIIDNRVNRLAGLYDKSNKTHQAGSVYDIKGLSPTLNTSQGGYREPMVKVRACLTPNRINKRQNGRRFKDDGEPSFTLTKQDIHGVAVKEKDYKIRKLTPLEYFRLQGFPDEWYYKCREEGISDTQMYRAAGDAVTVNVVQEIGRRLKEVE